MTAVRGVLDRVEELAKATPPVDNKASRFGNPAFRTFYDKVQEVCVPCCQMRIIMKVDTTCRLGRAVTAYCTPKFT